MKIKNFLEKTPGGMMLIPMLIGAIIHTFLPNILAYFGPFTMVLISSLASSKREFNASFVAGDKGWMLVLANSNPSMKKI